MRKAWARKNDIEMYEIPYRNPDNFNMYVYNDTFDYGYQEIMENHMLEFNTVLNKKDSKTEELWTIVESLGLWLNNDDDGSLCLWHGIEDGELKVLTCCMLGQMLLACLNRIDRDGEFKPDSKYNDLSLVIALWVLQSEALGTDVDDPFMTDEDREQDFPHSPYMYRLLWLRQLLIYCKENKVPIKGVADVDEKLRCSPEMLKARSSYRQRKQIGLVGRQKYAKAQGVSGNARTVMLTTQQYQNYVKIYNRGGKIGGKACRIIDWTRAKRAQYAYDKKDPLSDEEIKALKSGMVLQIR